jgi:hypothetical protein
MAYTTINKSGDYFNTKLYTGTGSSNALTGVGFQPDWVWIKNRTDAQSHVLQDAVRGVGNTIISNNTDAQSAEGAGDLTAFGSDGFTVGTNGRVNGSGKSIVAWNWKANGAGSSNTDGSITSTVSANTTSGFSIVKWTGNSTSGATVGHGLGVVPKMIIVKTTARTGNWVTYHHTLGATKYLELNNTGALGTSTAAWNDTAPTSSVFSLGSWSNTNDNGYGMIAYCFAEKTGYSKFGSYVGNNNADGTFVYTGFKPAWIMIKQTSDTNQWFIFDNKRNTFNPETLYIQANTSDGDNAFTSLDFTSNGFKFLTSNAAFNNGSYIYMAFAEAPLVGSNNVPCTAR